MTDTATGNTLAEIRAAIRHVRATCDDADTILAALGLQGG